MQKEIHKRVNASGHLQIFGGTDGDYVALVILNGYVMYTTAALDLNVLNGF